MTAEQSGEYLNYSASSIRRFARDGQLEYVRAGRGDYRFLKEWLDAFMLKSKPLLKPPPKPRLSAKRAVVSMFLQERLEKRRKRNQLKSARK